MQHIMSICTTWMKPTLQWLDMDLENFSMRCIQYNKNNILYSFLEVVLQSFVLVSYFKIGVDSTQITHSFRLQTDTVFFILLFVLYVCRQYSESPISNESQFLSPGEIQGHFVWRWYRNYMWYRNGSLNFGFVVITWSMYTSLELFYYARSRKYEPLNKTYAIRNQNRFLPQY